MAGHSHWKQIQHKKGAADQKRGQLFSKLLRAISIAAKTDPNPQFNPRLRSAIEKAKENSVPTDNIERAISKASEAKNLEDVIVEAYGPEGSALIITAVTDNKNRTIAAVRNILNERGAKMANPGSVLWAFNTPTPGQDWVAKFPQTISDQGKEQVQNLIAALEDLDDVQKVYTNISS
jgi:YebC/PmpR family DNA-binding regulatory protein